MYKRVYNIKDIEHIIEADGIKEASDVFKLKYFDLTDVVNNVKNVVITDGTGFILFHNINPGVYEAHPAFLKSGRGKKALKTSKKAIQYLFKNTSCMEIIAYCPIEYKHSQYLACMCGFKYEYNANIEFNNIKVGFKVYKLKYEDTKCRVQ